MNVFYITRNRFCIRVFPVITYSANSLIYLFTIHYQDFRVSIQGVVISHMTSLFLLTMDLFSYLLMMYTIFYTNISLFSGVFLVCWVPFFTINIINAICLRYDGRSTNRMCHLDDILFSLFTWLGYINSFLNPVIYTIFNPEFRKAFKKILTEKCP